MKTKQKPLTKKRKYTIHLFAEAMTYRVPLPVTKVIVYAGGAAYPLCPRCSMGLEREYMAFCDRCGQNLGWKFFSHAKVVRPGYNRK